MVQCTYSVLTLLQGHTLLHVHTKLHVLTSLQLGIYNGAVYLQCTYHSVLKWGVRWGVSHLGPHLRTLC